MQTPSIEALAKRLPLADRLIILGRAHASVTLSLRRIEEDLTDLVSQASDEDIRTAAKTLGCPPHLVRAIPQGINVILLLEGLRILEYLEDLPASGVADVAEARQVRGADAWRELARCIVKVGHEFPPDGPVWEAASPQERSAFLEALSYAQTAMDIR